MFLIKREEVIAAVHMGDLKSGDLVIARIDEPDKPDFVAVVNACLDATENYLAEERRKNAGKEKPFDPFGPYKSDYPVLAPQKHNWPMDENGVYPQFPPMPNGYGAKWSSEFPETPPDASPDVANALAEAYHNFFGGKVSDK